MTVPKPPFKLEGHCSVIHNNILYAYSPHGFSSIPLQENGNWTTHLPQGEKVSGALCLIGGIEGNESDEALYVVGGTGASSADYMGLQRFSFRDHKWESLNAGGGILKNLQHHGAGYLKSNSTIVIYGGSTDGNTTPSSASFTISTISPYVPNSIPPSAAPPAFEPMLMPWNESQVALIGGSSDPTIYVYSESTVWIPSGAALPAPVEGSVQCALIDSQGDKIVEEFNLSVDPNSVISYVVSNNGKPVSPATEVGASSGKRSVSNYPAYNGTFAPTQKHPDFSLAQGGNELVVISSGQSDHSLAVFNSTSNSWLNSTELFYGNSQQHTMKVDTTSTNSTTSATPTATSSPTSTNTQTSLTPVAGPSGGSGDNITTILGATLGTVGGVALILLALLFMLRRQKTKRHQVGQAGGDSKDRLSFQDQGIEPLTEGAYPMAKSPVPVATASNDSLAIMSGRATGEKSLKPPPRSAGYGLSKPGKSSPLSTIPSSGLAPSSMYSEDAERSPTGTQATAPGNKPGDRTTDEGWGKYFEDNNATNLAGMQPDRSTTSSVYTKSDYRGSAWPMTNLTPLNFGFLDQPKPLGRVVSGSPTTENASGRSLAIPESQSARISSADSESIASDDEHDPHDTNWTGAGQNSWLGRPTSSTYSNSFYNSSTRDLPGTASQSGYGPRASNGRRSSVVIPDDIDELPIQGRADNVNSDMSWLNIHADR